jgi:hypothetical protein
MKILIAVPSKNRVDILQKNAWPWLRLLDPAKYEVKIFVEPQDTQIYHCHFPSNIISIPYNNKGLGYAKLAMKNYAFSNGYDVVFKVDDDVEGFSNYRDTRTPEETAAWLNEYHEVFVKAFSKKDLGVIAFPYSFQMFEKGKGVKPTKRVQTAYLCRNDYMSYLPEISVFEDFTVGLHCLVDGKRILLFDNCGIQMGVKVGGGTGGHQSFDRKEQAYKEIDLMRQLYPPLKFKKVDKPWEVEPDIKSIKL